MTEPDTTYRCDECGETFAVQQRYASHARTTGHNVSGTRTARPTPTSRLGKLITRFGPRDTDGDGDLDVKRLGFVAFLVGLIAGHTAMHNPAVLGDSALGILMTLAGGRAVSRPKRSPIPRDWFDSRHFDMILFGAAVGAALVVLPFDQLLHLAGTHAHP